MKKQLILGLCTLFVASCTNSSGGRNYSTLADIFVWGDGKKTVETSQGVKVSYKEKLPQKTSDEKVVGHSDYKYNDDLEVKYVEVEKNTEESVAENVDEDIIIKEVIIETENPDKNAQTYTLTKRSERYKDVEDAIAPNVYAVLASRVVNKFLTDIPAYFADKVNPVLYMEETVYGDRFMPSNPDVAGATAKEIIIGSKMIPVVDDKIKANYTLKGRVSNINTPEVPVFKYEIGLYDISNKLVDSWSDTIRQVQNDDGSWW